MVDGYNIICNKYRAVGKEVPNTTRNTHVPLWGNMIYLLLLWLGYCRRKKRKTGYVYVFGIFSFCVYFLYASVQQNLIFSNIIFISTYYRILYCLFRWFWYDGCTTATKKCWENMVRILYVICSFLYYIVHTDNSSQFSSTVYLLLFIVVGVWKWWRIFCLHIIANGVGIHFFMALLSMFSVLGIIILVCAF